MGIDRFRDSISRYFEDSNERQVLDAFQLANPGVSRRDLANRRDELHQEVDRMLLDGGDVLLRYPGASHLTAMDPFDGLNQPVSLRASSSTVAIPPEVLGRLGLSQELPNE